MFPSAGSWLLSNLDVGDTDWNNTSLQREATCKCRKRCAARGQENEKKPLHSSQSSLFW